MGDNKTNRPKVIELPELVCMFRETALAGHVFAAAVANIARESDLLAGLLEQRIKEAGEHNASKED